MILFPREVNVLAESVEEVDHIDEITLMNYEPEAEETLERVEAEVVGDEAPKMDYTESEETSGPYVSNSFNENSLKKINFHFSYIF